MVASCNLKAEVTPVFSAPLASLLPENRTFPPATILLHPQARGSKMGLGLIRSASRVRCRVLTSQRPRHEALPCCTSRGSTRIVRHARQSARQHQDVLRTREGPVLCVQPRKNSKRARPVLSTQELPPSRLERSCLRRWAHRAQLARVVISCGKQRPSAWAEETKKRGLTRRKRFSTVTEALFRVLNTLSDPFHVQYVPHGQFESTM